MHGTVSFQTGRHLGNFYFSAERQTIFKGKVSFLMFNARAAAIVYENLTSRMSVIRNCHNLCTVLRQCLVEDSSIIEALEERTVAVRCVDEDQNLYINTKVDGKPRNYVRNKAEPLKSTLSRMHISLVNPISKKKLRKREKQILEGKGLIETEHKYPDNVTVKVKRLEGIDSVVVDDHTSNIDAWRSDNILVIGNEEFLIRVNAPTVLAVTLPDNAMSGFPIIPNLELEFANRDSSKFMWFRKKIGKKEGSTTTFKNANDASEKCCKKNAVWEFVSNKFMYTPENKDIGYQLKFICVPKRGDIYGFSHEAVAKLVVGAGPGICPFDERHLYTSKVLSDENLFRVVSYNILADIYCSTDFARTHLYPYCISYALDFSYRGQLMLKELLGYNADIICLQECDQKVFNAFLQPTMKDAGFAGYYMRKAGEMPEGEALFYRNSKFSVIRESGMILSEAVNFKCNKHIFNTLEGCPELLESLKKRTAVGQIVALRDNVQKNRAICVLNTHLFFRPEATNIRLLQMSLLINCLNNFVKELTEQQDELNIDKIAILICGDFNSTPDKAVIEFLLKGVIPGNHQVWNSDNATEKIMLDLSHDLKLFSACGFPRFTNYVAGFKDTLDYIIPDEMNFKVESHVPFPEEHLLALHTALPSITAPSDHLALVCDLSWNVQL